MHLVDISILSIILSLGPRCHTQHSAPTIQAKQDEFKKTSKQNIYSKINNTRAQQLYDDNL